MKHPAFKIAAAAIIVFAIILGFNPFTKGSVTFAQVVEYILNARTVELDFIAGEEGSGPIIHDIIKGNRIRRTISNVDSTMILDVDSGKMLLLTPANQIAAIVDIQGTVSEGTREMLDMIRNIVSRVEDNPEIVVQELGKRDFDGVEAVGFQVKDLQTTINLWADPITASPKRIELNIGQTKTILMNIQFDVLISDDQISMEVPQGYTLAQPITMSEPTEEDLVATLGLWAEHVNGGTFPNEISVQELMKLQPDLITALGQMEGSEQEKTELGMHYGRTVMFISLLGQQGEYHYAGQGVAFGDADTAVLWYRQGDAKTYRVIYGDLHVEEVALDLLPH